MARGHRVAQVHFAEVPVVFAPKWYRYLYHHGLRRYSHSQIDRLLQFDDAVKTYDTALLAHIRVLQCLSLP
ncbi:hypothetical protein D3C79_932740 [compost metagenome]